MGELGATGDGNRRDQVSEEKGNANEELLGGKVETQCNGNLLESKKETDGPETRGWKAQIPSVEPNTTGGGKIRKSMK